MSILQDIQDIRDKITEAHEALLGGGGIIPRLERIEHSLYSGAGEGLVITSASIAQKLESTNYVADTSGWIINKTGVVELEEATIRGTIYAEAGEFEGAVIIGTGGSLSSGQTAYNTGTGFWMEYNAGTPRLSLGTAGGAGLTWDGAAFAINGAITATSGIITGTLYIGTSPSRVVIDGAAGKSLYSEDYTANVDGWYIQGSGWAEFEDVIVRGELRTSVFTKNYITATAGSQIIVKGAGTLATNFTSTAGNDTINIAPVAGTALDIADIGDILYVKHGTDATWYEVTGVGLAGGGTYYYYEADYKSGTVGADYKQGMCILNYGASGDGTIVLTADASNAPHVAIRTHAAQPWATETTRAMLGNCNGEYGIVADYYGIGVGDYDGGDGSYFYAIPENSPAMVLRTASTGIETTTKGMNVLGLINIDDNYDFQIGFGKDGNEEEGKIYGIINETLNRTEMAIAAGGVTASTYYEGRILLGGYGSTANNKAQLWIGNDAASSLTEADFTFKVASGGGADNLFMKLDKNGLWFNNDADSGILMTTEDKTQFQIAGGVDVTIQADLLKLETGTELGYDGAAAPFSQTAITDALQTGFAHICEGGHPENPYPRTRNTLDSEFNNAAAADNNDVTDTGGGGTWDFDAAPNAYGVGSGEYDSHLYVRTNNEVRYATRSIPRLGVDDIKVVRMYVHQVTCNWFQPWRLIIRFHDSVNSTYAGLQLETNSTADNVLVSAIHDLGGGAVTSVAAYLGGNFMGPFTMCVKRYESANNAYYRAMFGMGHDGYSNNDWINIAGVGADTNFRPDQVRIFFQSYGATYTTFYIDSVRFEDA